MPLDAFCVVMKTTYEQPIDKLVMLWLADTMSTSQTDGKRLAEFCGVDIEIVKEAITRLKNGGHLSLMRLEDGGVVCVLADMYLDDYWRRCYAMTTPRAKAKNAGRSRWDSKRSIIAPLVYERDGRICAHCGRTDWLTIDHIIPISRGGTDVLSNLRVLCHSCNSRKGARV